MSERRRIVDTSISRRGLLTLGGGTVAAALLAACSTTKPEAVTSSSSSAVSAAPRGKVTFVPAPSAEAIEPLGVVMVTATEGTLSAVTMTNDQGKPVDGIMTPDNTTWKPAVALGYGRTYELTATCKDAQGRMSTFASTFRTVQPDNLTKASLVTTGGGALVDNGTYGVGIVAVVTFDEPVPDRAAAQRCLSVQTQPPAQGSWSWVDDQNVHYRPREYYPSGTTVTIRADIYGKQLGAGLYGQEDLARSFTIGNSHVSIADDNTKQVVVYDNGRPVRTMPTSMGRGGTETVNGRTIHFWTQRGIYTVLDKANPVVMDSSTYGLPVNSRLGYRQVISYATRISNDGIYLHQLEASVPQQGNTNVSAGCLNLNPDNAQWFYDFSIPGDVVEVRNTGGEPLQQWQNGDWSVPWETWTQGSAL